MSKLPNFASNKKCWMYLNSLAFGEDYHCPFCDQLLQLNYQKRYAWCKTCRRKLRPTAFRASWLYGMKLKPRQLVILLWCWQNKKSPDTARLLVRASYTTVNRWYGRFRSNLQPSQLKLTGLIQTDESYFGRKRSKQPQLIVSGGINAQTNQIALQIITDRGRDEIEQFVIENVTEGSLVVSDGWYAYDELPLLGYGHEQCNHSKGEFGPTNQIEGLWSSIKRYLRRLYNYSIPTRKLESILKEWVNRYNHPELFESPYNYLKAMAVPY